MLKYFLDNNSLEPVTLICNELNKIKTKISKNDFSNPYEILNNCSNLFEKIEATAYDKDDELLANSQVVFQCYFELFCNLAKYFDLLSKKEYKNSWIKLQDCFDNIAFVNKFTKKSNRLETDSLYDLLTQYEALYPYEVFLSSDFIVNKSHCSICGKSMLSLDCPHIKGNLYWGKIAQEVFDDIQTINAICLVSHPDDKRCIIEDKDDKRSEEEKFLKLHQFISLKQPFLQQFTVSAREGYKKDETIKEVGRNDLCPCGSGKKFKKCCGRNIYKEHIYYTVKPLNTVKLIIL